MLSESGGALLESKWSMKYLKVPMGNLGKSKAILKYLKFLILSLLHSDSYFRSQLKDHFFLEGFPDTTPNFSQILLVFSLVNPEFVSECHCDHYNAIINCAVHLLSKCKFHEGVHLIHCFHVSTYHLPGMELVLLNEEAIKWLQWHDFGHYNMISAYGAPLSSFFKLLKTAIQ